MNVMTSKKTDFISRKSLAKRERFWAKSYLREFLPVNTMDNHAERFWL